MSARSQKILPNSPKNSKNSPEPIRQKTRSLDQCLSSLKTALKTSVFLNELKRTSKKKLRNLTSQEINLLEKQGNQAKNWKLIKVTDGFTTENIQGSTFLGKATLGRFREKKHPHFPELPAGIYNSTLCDVTLEDDTLLFQVGMIFGVKVCKNAAILQCTSLRHDGSNYFSLGESSTIINESGGHDFTPFPEIDPELAKNLCRPKLDLKLEQKYTALLQDYAKKAESTFSVVAENALVQGCQKVHNFYLGPHSVIDHATSLDHVIVLSDRNSPSRIGAGVQLTNSIAQWGTEIMSSAQCNNSFVAEASEISKGAFVDNSYIGPNCQISEGEVTCCFLGPFVVSHHQALLIAMYWPEGRGNIGYGANVGSNHTGRAPDQECHIGEGMFFGLTCAIKYPANFMASPYTIISTSVTTLSQLCGMPFSLINLPGECPDNVSPAYNEILPGWMISENFYALLRAEHKYTVRDHTRHYRCSADFYTPELMAKVITARELLQRLNGKNIYTDRDLFQLGKNYLREDNRLRALKAYKDLIDFYCLKNFYLLLKECPEPEKMNLRQLLKKRTNRHHWNDIRTLFQKEIGLENIKDCLQKYIDLRMKFHLCINACKLKDDGRAFKVFGDDHLIPQLAEKDPIIKKDKHNINEIKRFLRDLKSTTDSKV